MITDAITLLREAFALAGSIAAVLEEHSELDAQYAEMLNAVLLLQLQLKRVQNSPRIPMVALPCVGAVRDAFTALSAALEARRRESAARRALRLVLPRARDPLARAQEQLRALAERLEILLRLKELLDAEGRFDAAGVLAALGDDAVAFWDTHVGSEHLGVGFGTFVQSLELGENRRLRAPEREVLRAVLDPDSDGTVSVYEFARWIAHFGPVRGALGTTLESVFDPENSRVWPWYRQDMFFDGAVKELLRAGTPGASCIVRYGASPRGFVIDVLVREGELGQICVERGDGVFHVMVCAAGGSDPTTSSPFGARAVAGAAGRTGRRGAVPASPNTMWAHRVLRSLLLVGEAGTAGADGRVNFATLPEVVAALQEVIFLEHALVERRRASAHASHTSATPSAEASPAPARIIPTSAPAAPVVARSPRPPRPRESVLVLSAPPAAPDRASADAAATHETADCSLPPEAQAQIERILERFRIWPETPEHAAGPPRLQIEISSPVPAPHATVAESEEHK